MEEIIHACPTKTVSLSIWIHTHVGYKIVFIYIPFNFLCIENCKKKGNTVLHINPSRKSQEDSFPCDKSFLSVNCQADQVYKL